MWRVKAFFCDRWGLTLSGNEPKRIIDDESTSPNLCYSRAILSKTQKLYISYVVPTDDIQNFLFKYYIPHESIIEWKIFDLLTYFTFLKSFLVV